MPKKSRTSYHHGDLRSALLTAAAELLERDGPEGISLRALARAAGVSQTAPYNHFPDKTELLATLAADGFAALTAAQADAAGKASTPSAQIVAIGSAYVSFARGHPQLYRLMFGAGVADWRGHRLVEEAKHGSYEPVKQAVIAVLGERAEMETEVVNIAAWALVHGLAMLLIDGTLAAPEEGAAPLVEAVLERFVTGLAENRRDGR